MSSEYHKGLCMMCHKAPVEVRHINLYVIGSEGFYCCRACEDKILEFIREERRKIVYDTIKRWRSKTKGK